MGDVEVSLEGFSGATPYEVCEKYARGEISRERLMDELYRWPYTPIIYPKDLWDDLVQYDECSTRAVVEAYRDKLIDTQIYEEFIYNRPKVNRI